MLGMTGMTGADVDLSARDDRVSLKARLAAGERALGVLLRMPGEELVEMVAVAGFDFVLVDGEHGPADVVELRRHIAAASSTACRCWSGWVPPSRPSCCAPSTRARSGSSPRTSTPPSRPPPWSTPRTTRRSGTAGSRPTDGRAASGSSTHGAHQERMLAETLVFGMIESPAGVRAAEAIVATEGLDGIMVGVADLAASTTADDPPHPDQVRHVHQVLADQDKLRMDIVNSLAAAEKSFADGAQVVVYNLTATLMAHLGELRGARP